MKPAAAIPTASKRTANAILTFHILKNPTGPGVILENLRITPAKPPTDAGRDSENLPKSQHDNSLPNN